MDINSWMIVFCDKKLYCKPDEYENTLRVFHDFCEENYVDFLPIAKMLISELLQIHIGHVLCGFFKFIFKENYYLINFLKTDKLDIFAKSISQKYYNKDRSLCPETLFEIFKTISNAIKLFNSIHFPLGKPL